MKKLLTLLASVVLSGTATFAQFDIGFAGGPALTTFTGKDAKSWGGLDSNPSMQVKFHIGVLLNYEVNDKISVQPRLLFTSKGTKYTGTVQGVGEETRKKMLTYLDLPVLVRYMITEQIYAMAGPQLSFLLSAKYSDDDGTLDVKDEYGSIDLAFVLGLGYAITQSLGLNLSYDLGLTSAVQYESASSSYSVKNGVVRLALVFILQR